MSAIIKAIWTFLGPTLVKIILDSGLPAGQAFLESLKWMPRWLINGLMAFAKAILGDLTGIVKIAHQSIQAIKNDDSLSPQEKKWQIGAVKRQAKRDARRTCSGAGCMMETKEL